MRRGPMSISGGVHVGLGDSKTSDWELELWRRVRWRLKQKYVALVKQNPGRGRRKAMDVDDILLLAGEIGENPSHWGTWD